MEIKNNELLWIKRELDNTLANYGVHGRISTDRARENFKALTKHLKENIQIFKDRAHKKKFPNDSNAESSKQRALMILNSGSMDLIKDALKKEKDNFTFIFTVCESLFVNKKDFSDADRASLSNVYMDARQRSGYNEIDDAIHQGQVMLKELTAYENYIGTCGYSELLMKASNARAPEEIGYVLRKEKLQTRPAYVLYEQDNKEAVVSVV